MVDPFSIGATAIKFAVDRLADDARCDACSKVEMWNLYRMSCCDDVLCQKCYDKSKRRKECKACGHAVS